jgi:hypothetical protein
LVEETLDGPFGRPFFLARALIRRFTDSIAADFPLELRHSNTERANFVSLSHESLAVAHRPPPIFRPLHHLTVNS